MADLAVATEETALLLKMAVDGPDDAMTLAEDLVGCQTELARLEPDSNIRIGFVCYQDDYDEICSSVEKTIKENDLHVFKLGNLYDEVIKVFVDCGDSLEKDLPSVKTEEDDVLVKTEDDDVLVKTEDDDVNDV